MSEATKRQLDRAELERLYARLERPLYNVVYRWLWDREEARDVVQEAFVRLWRKRADVDLASVEALTYRIALNLASNRRRARKVWRWVSLEPVRQRATGEPPADEILERRDLRAAVDALPEQLRRIVMLCEFSDLSHREIGELLGIPSGTVGSRRHRALAALREQLGEPDEG
jgi:RNA polymerase sigma-70 factor (ECF subfamily)